MNLFTITSRQYQAFQNIEEQKFTENSVDFLMTNFTDWSRDKSKEELVSFVKSIVDLGSQYNISSHLNLQKLMYYNISLGFDIPLNKALEESINIKNRHEDFLMRSFLKALKERKPLIQEEDIFS